MTTDGAVAAGSGAGPTELYPSGDESADDVGRENVFAPNDTREALSHDGSEHNSVSVADAILRSSVFINDTIRPLRVSPSGVTTIVCGPTLTFTTVLGDVYARKYVVK